MKSREPQYFWGNLCYANDPSFAKLLIERVWGTYAFSGKSVLDIGCGDGTYCSVFLKKGAAKAVGIDSSPAAIEQANKNLPKDGYAGVSFQCTSLDSFQSEDKYDTIWCHGVIYYVSDPELFVRKLCGLVKPGGRVFISFNKASLLSKSINLIRKILSILPHSAQKTLAMTAANLLSINSNPVEKPANVSRIYAKAMAQCEPLLHSHTLDEASRLFMANGFSVEAVFPNLDVLSYSTDFGIIFRNETDQKVEPTCK